MEVTEQQPNNAEEQVVESLATRELPNRDMALMSEYIAYAIKRSDQQKMLSQLPLIVKKRVRALRKLQVQTTNLEADFHQQVYELERKYQKKHEDVFLKRHNIINGIYQPTDEECDYPDAEISPDIMQAMQALNVNREGAENVTPVENLDANGIPNFWLNIFKYVPLFESMVKETDEPVLKYLTDIRVTSKPLPDLSFTLEFHFASNEYFTDTVLTKEYLMKCTPDPEDPFSFDGPEIYKSRGCEIHWKEGKDLTVKTVKKKHQLCQDRAGHPRTVKTETFFNYFDPPEIPEDENDPQFDEINNLLEADFEIGHFLKERVIPRAILYFTGENDDDITEDSSDTMASEDYEISEESVGNEDALTNNDGEGDVPA